MNNKIPFIINWIRTMSDSLLTLTEEEKRGYKQACKDMGSIFVAYDIPVAEIHAAFKKK